MGRRMEIAFFTEGNWSGKVTRDNPNMRTEMACMCALNADHYNLNTIPNKTYDLGIVIIPKKNPTFDDFVSSDEEGRALANTLIK